jgi:hypothetical protein
MKDQKRKRLTCEVSRNEDAADKALVVGRRKNHSSSHGAALRRLPPTFRRNYLSSCRAYRDLCNAVARMSALLNGASP